MQILIIKGLLLFYYFMVIYKISVKDLIKNGDEKNALQNLELSIQDQIKNNKVDNKKDNNSRRIINNVEGTAMK